MFETKEITDLFGFDLGDGESAVAWMRWGSPVAPQMMEIAGRKSFLTALGEHPKMGALIGEQALMVDAERRSVRFKGRFLTHPIAASQIESFARAVLEALRQSGKAEDMKRCAFFVGCPSGWREADRARYQKLFERAGMERVAVISESRAAFMFVRESGEVRATRATLNRPTLIVDAGSSTTDFTFVDRLEARPVDFGETFGGGLIDQLLMELNLRRSPAEARIREIFRLCPPYRARCELESRKVKEQYFSRTLAANGAARFPVPCESSVKIYYDDPPLTLDIAASDEDMDLVLNHASPALGGRSVLTAFRQGFARARALLQAEPPEVILLTGGASRMGFVADLASEAFPEALMLRGAEPEFAIARGLCYALNVDLRAACFREDVRALIDSGEIGRAAAEKLPDLYRAAAPIIVSALIDDCAIPAFRRWKRGETDTIDDMGEEIGRLVAEDLASGDAHARLTQAAADWAPSLRPALEAMTDPISARYGLNPATLRPPAAFYVSAGDLDLRTRGGMLDLSYAQTAVDLAVASVAGALLGGGGVALLMAGPAGFAISFALGFAASRIGTTLAKPLVGRASIPAWMRRLFSERAYRAGLERKRAQLEDGVLDRLSGNLRAPGESAQATLGALTAAIAQQLNAQADEARLLIR
jgi:hypothetical protein